MTSKARPTGVTADRQRRLLIIEWSDGRVAEYPFAGLRAVCPCVACRGGHANMGGPADREVLYSTQDDSLNLERIEPVGSYALQFIWSDGHATGIYTWDYLLDARL